VITIAIPALNESATIGDVVCEVRPYGDEVLVVDGGSRDGTPDLAAAAGARVVFDGGGGKGKAIRTAGREATGDVIVFFDADGSHIAADIPKLVAPILEGRADHVTASRLIGGSSELHGGFDEFLRLSGSAFITACINKRFGVRLSDSQNGFRAIRRELLNRLNLVSLGTTIEQEMIARTLRLGARMAEVPSHERPRRAGKSHIDPVIDAPRYLGSLLRDVLL
jgi:glycosyltransferase involved in cell wall biosynthesis